MTINTPNAQAFLGKLPLTAGEEPLKTVHLRRRERGRQDLQGGHRLWLAADEGGVRSNLERSRQAARHGSVQDLAGTEVKVDLNADGTATLTANAAAPRPDRLRRRSRSPSRSTIKADLRATSRCRDCRSTSARRTCSAIHLKNLLPQLRLRAARGARPDHVRLPRRRGHRHQEVRHQPTRGKLEALEIDYLAGAGQGFPVGPGLFLTQLGGGFQAPDPLELDGDAALSVTPSDGEGCPTAGIDGDLHVHTSARSR